MKISMTKDGFTYDIKPYFNMAFLFSPMTFIFMNMFYSFYAYLLLLVIINSFKLLVVAIIINIILFFIGGHLRILYLHKNGYVLLENSSDKEIKIYNKIIGGFN